jgi:hypothetical protein
VDHDIPKVNYRAIVVACLAAILVITIWSSPYLFGKQWMELRSAGPPGTAGTINDDKLPDGIDQHFPQRHGWLAAAEFLLAFGHLAFSCQDPAGLTTPELVRSGMFFAYPLAMLRRTA